MEEARLHSEYFEPTGEVIESISPSKKYTFLKTIFRYTRTNLNFEMAELIVYETKSQRKIIDVNIEHTNWHLGHWISIRNKEYLFFSEKLGGLSVIDLELGERASYYNSNDEFIIVDVIVAKNESKIAFDGCFWGCPYEFRICSVRDIMQLPYQIVEIRPTETGLTSDFN